MTILEIQKVVNHIIEYYGEDASLYPYDTDVVLSLPASEEDYYMDKDIVRTYEDFLTFEKEEILPSLQRQYNELTDHQKKLSTKIEKLLEQSK